MTSCRMGKRLTRARRASPRFVALSAGTADRAIKKYFEGGTGENRSTERFPSTERDGGLEARPTL